MGRARRKYGKECQESRCSSSIKTDLLSEKDACYLQEGSNVLVLDSKHEKQRTKVIPSRPKKLSKKRKKELQRVLDQKEKKAKRADLLEKLSQVQVKPSELAMMSSIAHLGTRNSSLKLSKRPLPDELMQEVEKLNSIRGAKRRKRKMEKVEQREEEDSTDTSDVSLSSDDEAEKEIHSDNENAGQSDVEVRSPDPAPEINCQTQEKPPEDFSNSTGPKNITSSVENKKAAVDTLRKETASLPALSTSFVLLDREPAVQEARLKLPILAEEQAIMEAIRHNHTVVLCGETGSGKTTQVPQFLYEAGYAKQGLIGITEPRRVAAISMSQRVANEMNLPSSKVSYQIRYEGNVTNDTEVKFMTDGVLLREVQEDFLLSRYSAIIIDEAHERSVYTDVLIGLLSRIVPLRNKKGNPLRLVVMSATLRVEDFTQNSRLFKTPPPVLKVETRQYPVTVHFNKRTPIEGHPGSRPYIKEAFKKICKIHRTLPAGGILVFVTGQNEVHSLCKLLKSTFPSTAGKRNATRTNPEKDVVDVLDTDHSDESSRLPDVDLQKYPSLPEDKPEEEDVTGEDDRDAPAGFSDEEDLESDDDMLNDANFTKEVDQSLPMHVLPLYSLLSPARQRDVFRPSPPDTRLCVIATNVAETSLTIPGAKYIVDTGKVKRRVYDKVTGISSFQISWVSKASANQRAGRAGRVGAGHAYRLYSSAVFQDFGDFSAPEIASRPVPGLVLQMKQLNIERVVNFPFPTPPAEESLKAAEDLLVSLGAVEKLGPRKALKNKAESFGGPITDLGRSMAAFPVHPRFGKMLATATAEEHKELLPYVITIVATLTIREVFVEQSQPPATPEEKDAHRHMAARLAHMKSIWSGGTNESAKAFGDLMVLLGAVGSAEYTGLTYQLCNQNCLRHKALLEIRKLRAQLVNIVNSVNPSCNLYVNSKMEPPDNRQIKLLRQIVLSAMGDHVARKIAESQMKNSNDAKEVKRLAGAYSCLLTTEPVFIHPSSVMCRSAKLPEYVVFQEIVETKRLHMKGVMAVEQEWLPVLCPQYCTFSQPLEEPAPFLNKSSGRVECHANATYGRLSWPLGTVVITHPPGLGRYKWFARFMLKECIVEALPRQFSSLLSQPEIMTKSWANLQPRTQTLLRALVKEEVDEKRKLVEAWSRDKEFLLREFQEWLPESIRDDVTSRWPPKLKE